MVARISHSQGSDGSSQSGSAPSIQQRHLIAAFSLLAASTLFFGAVGSLLVAGLASFIQAFRAIGVRFLPMPVHALGCDRWSRIGPFVVAHCHHEPAEWARHEFSILGKNICAGCVGLALGAVFGPILAALTLMDDASLSISAGNIFTVGAILAVVTVVLQITDRSGPRLRAVVYMSLPVIAWFGVAELHRSFESAAVNIAAMTAIVLAWYCGCIVYRRIRVLRTGTDKLTPDKG